MVESPVAPARWPVLTAATMAAVVAAVVLVVAAVGQKERPEPIPHLSDRLVAAAADQGLELRVNQVATEAAQEDAEEAAIAALGERVFAEVRETVSASLARVFDHGERVGDGLVWVVYADGLLNPAFGAVGSSQESGRTFVVVDDDSFKTLGGVDF